MIINKPWGHEIIWIQNDHYVGKIIVINPGHKLSRQYHNNKCESFYVLKGTLTLEIGNPDNECTHHHSTLPFYIRPMQPGESFDCPNFTIHRMINDTDALVEVMEISTSPLKDMPEDIVRLEDDYNRK